jgi:hypothetical protein
LKEKPDDKIVPGSSPKVLKNLLQTLYLLFRLRTMVSDCFFKLFVGDGFSLFFERVHKVTFGIQDIAQFVQKEFVRGLHFVVSSGGYTG